MRCQQFFPIATVQVNQEVTDAKDLALNHRPNLIAEAGNQLLILKNPVQIEAVLRHKCRLPSPKAANIDCMQEEDRALKAKVPLMRQVHQRLDSDILAAMDCRTNGQQGLGGLSFKQSVLDSQLIRDGQIALIAAAWRHRV